MGPAFRNELKFLLSSAEDRQLQNLLHSLLAHDPRCEANALILNTQP